MPFYEYQCRACGEVAEVLQKVSDPPLRKCPSCGKNQLAKLVSAPIFRLKGGGWYETDFKSEQDTKRNLVGEKDEAKPAADDKPEKKADAGDAKADAPKADAKPAAADAKAAAKPKSRPVKAAVKSKAKKVVGKARR